MPSVDFTPPHWLYWLLVVSFPIIAFLMVRRHRGVSSEEPSYTLAYFILITAGYLGLHRIYLKNLWGLVYIVLFGALLWNSSAVDVARVEASNASAATRNAERDIARTERAITRSQERIEGFERDLATRDPESALYRRADRSIERERDKLSGAREDLEAARQDLAAAQPLNAEAEAALAGSEAVYSYILYAIVALMAADLLLMPLLMKRAREKIAASPPKSRPEPPPSPPDTRFVSRRGGFTGFVDRVCLTAGELASYWTVIAVFAFCYEVVVRKAFNSPTDWVHETVVYLFAMQYMIAGSYAMLTESHVRVDIFYARFSPRMKAIVDLVTSIFFFIFVCTLLFAGFVFAADSLGFGNTSLSALARGNIDIYQFLEQASLAEFFAPDTINGEVVNSTWRLQLWPVKIVLVVGALLLLLQGVSRVVKDAFLVITGEPHTRAEA